MQLGRNEEAVDSFRHACELKPDDSEIWFLKGIVLGDLSRFEEGLNAFNHVCILKPDDSDNWQMKGTSLGILGRSEEALEALIHAKKLGHEDNSSLYLIGLTLFESENFEDLSSLTIDFNIPGIYKAGFLKGYGLAAVGKWNEALEVIEKSLSQMESKKEIEIDSDVNIASLLFDHHNHSQWTVKANELASLFRKFNYLDGLSANVLNSLEKFFSPMTSLAMANEWLTAWEKAAGSDAEFTITLEIMRTALKYKKNPGDERVFMELPVEERTILKQLIEKKGIISKIQSEKNGGN